MTNRKETIPKLKKKAWTEFSKYIRLRDCIKTTSTPDRGKCFTCDREYPFKQLQAGHFVDGRSATILFHEELVNAQCYSCNIHKSGNKDSYTPKMIHKFGLKKVEEFWVLAKQTHKWTKEELKDIRKKYKEEYQDLLNLNGLG